ncbi:MAG TPA: glycosyltransferase family 1 protein [Candidatus Tumulicola sp.]|nr:glycosyltransferase family 1 protein [Candidatus Tumulicola sp.]
MSSLRLAVDARVVAEDTRGIGRYARAVLRRLILRDDVDLTLLARGPLPSRYRNAYARALGSARFSVRGAVGKDRQVVWHPANGTFFASKLPSVATIHDAVPFRYPDPDPRRRDRDQKPFLESVRTAARIVAVSDFGRDEVHRVFGVPLERIEVVHHGIEPSFSPGLAQPLPAGLFAKRYLLFVGDPIAEPRKNFALLYDAYRRAWPGGGAPPLVVAGARAPQLPGVVHAGNLGDDLTDPVNPALRALYRGAIAVAVASYHETFGMPLLEAMACGTPVIASRSSSLPEIGGDAPLYVPHDDAAAWAEALRRLSDDPALCDRLRVAGLHRATAFDWDDAAQRHLAVFRTVARAPA